MKNLFVFLFACCVQAVSATYANVPSGTNIEKPVFMVLLVLKCHMALWHKWHKFHI